MSEDKKYPSGGNYPETKEDYVVHFFDLLETASPEKLNEVTQKWLRMGGKWRGLALLIMGMSDFDE